MTQFVEKNQNQAFQISREEWKGYDLLHIRVVFFDKNGNPRPTKQGVAVRMDRLPDLLDAIQRETEEVAA